MERFQRLNDNTYTEHDPETGWRGTSRFQHGLATGRPSPQMPSRVRPVTGIMRGKEDLVTETDIAGHGHGQFFDVAPYVESHSATLHAAGVPERRQSSGEGFLPRLGSAATSEGAERASIVQGKMEALGQAAAITRPVHKSAASFDLGELGTPTPLKTQMENRSKFVSPNIHGDWYVTESAQVNDAATRQGVPHGTMRRATAIASPKTAWDRGHPQEGNVHYPNLAAAEAVVGHVTVERKRAANEGRGFDAVETALGTRTPTVSGEGERMPAFKRVMSSIGKTMSPGASPGDAMQTAGSKTPLMVGEKVPNFDLALARGDESRTVRRESAQAYTSDVWDTRTAGINDYAHVAGGGLTEPGGTQRRTGGDKGLVPNKPRGQYDIAAMTGRRAGLKAGMLPSEMQQHIWRGARPPGGTEQQLFAPYSGDNPEGKEGPTSAALPERTGSRNRIVNTAAHEAWLNKNDDF